jgi:hypothetical protein
MCTGLLEKPAAADIVVEEEEEEEGVGGTTEGEASATIAATFAARSADLAVTEGDAVAADASAPDCSG